MVCKLFIYFLRKFRTKRFMIKLNVYICHVYIALLSALEEHPSQYCFRQTEVASADHRLYDEMHFDAFPAGRLFQEFCVSLQKAKKLKTKRVAYKRLHDSYFFSFCGRLR